MSAGPDLDLWLSGAAIVAICGGVVVHYFFGKAQLRRWAQTQNLDLVRFTGAWNGTPFSSRYMVFTVAARDAEGHTRMGTVACGGLISSEVHVLWD